MHRMDIRRVVGNVSLKTVAAKTATIFGLAFLALFVPAAQAQGPLNYFKNYFVTGDYVAGGVGLANVKPVKGPVTGAVELTTSITLNSVPCTTGPGLLASVIPCTNKGAVPADIIAAFLYWQTIESTTTPSAANGSFSGSFVPTSATNPNDPVNPFVGLALGNPQISACSGLGTSAQYMHNYRADVLKYLPINSTANVRWTANKPQTFTLVSGDTTTQFIGATLVFVYRLVTPGNPRIAPLRSVVIYDGAFTGTQTSSLIQTMGGFYQASSDADAKMTHIVGNGQPVAKGSKEKQTLEVNGGIPQGVPSDPFVGAQGANWDNYSFNYNLSPNASTVTTQVPLTDDCLSWAAVITSTNVQDSDFDGLLDIWETSGLYFNPGVRNDGILPSKIVTPTTPAAFGTCAPPNAATCLNLPGMGAKPNTPDIFMQIDWMQSSRLAVPDHVHMPQLAALNMVAAAFQTHGINLHFDVGSNYQTPPPQPPYVIIPAKYAQGGNVVPESNLLCPNAKTSTCAFPQQEMDYSLLGWKSGLDAIKNGDSVLGLLPLFAANRKDTFHYALFAHGIAATTPLSAPLAGSISGVGDLPGGDLLVTLGLWRSDNAAVDQVGSPLEQAGTLMHELGHNLDLHHGGWNDTPVCMADYPSVMNYMYQVAGLTDSAGTEHIDYSYGLELPMSEDLLDSAIPMGIQQYRVRYFGPSNSAVNTPGQAAQVYCNGALLNAGASPYVRLEGATVSTPDWSNGTLPLGKLITKGLDINYDGTVGQTFTDSPDWYSLNLQQVGARPNANGLSLNVGISDIGISDIGISDIGISDIGISDIGISDIGISDIGISDIGTAQLGQDSLGDSDQATVNSSGGASPPTGLGATVTTNQPTSPAPANPNPGGTGNVLGWTGGASEVAFQYNIYRCNSSTKACTPAGPAIASVTSGSPVITTYTDFVNDYVDAGATCPANSTCYNTSYTYGVTELPQVMVGPSIKAGTESLMSNLVTGEVNHLFVMGNISTTPVTTPPSIVYGAANPTIAKNIYGTVAGSLTASQVTCVYTNSPSSTTGLTPRNVMSTPYSIYCSGPSTVSPTSTDGITYNVSYLGNSPSTLTITPRPITVTEAASSKVYDSNLTCPTPTCTSAPVVTWAGSGPALAYSSDTPNFSESFDNKNVGTTHTVTPAGTVNDGGTPVGNNYSYTFVPIHTGIITPAALTITASTNTKFYDGTTSGAAIPTTSVVCDGSTVTGPPALCGTTDMVANLAETYNSANAGNSVPITVSSGYVINDSNSGKNYTVSTNGTTGIINPAPVTAAAGSYSGIYNGASQSPSACAVTPNAPNTYTGSLTCTNNPASVGPNVGSGTVTPVPAVGANNSLTNYAIASVNGSWNIAQAPVTATAGTYSGTYNAATQSPSPCTVTPNAPNAFTGTLTCTNSPASVGPNAGSGTVTPVPAVGANNSLSNYAITSVNGSWIINQATPTVTDSGPAPTTPDYGQPVTLTVTVAPPLSGEAPSGTVTFSFTLNTVTNYICSNGTISTSTPACTVPLTLSGGNYVASVTTTSNLPTGAENVMATYSGDPNFLGKPANNLSVTVSKASSGVTLTKSTDPTTYGTPANLTVKVVDATGGSIGVPTGTVTLLFQLDPTVQTGQVYYICADGSVVTAAPCVNPITLAPDPMNPIGAIATVPTSALPAGLATFANPGANPPTPFSYPINATYSGDTNFASSTIGLSQTVNQLAASVTPSAARKTYGAADPTLTGSLSGFLPSDNFTATYSRTAGETVAGSPYTISAVLSPTSVLNNYNITYNTANFTITAASTTTTISSVSPSPATTGVPVTVTVVVAPVPPGAGTPTGTATVGSGAGGPTCTTPALSSGTASCTLTFVNPGTPSLTASFTSASTNFNGSTSGATPLTVNPGLTSITVAPAPHTSFTGDTVWVNYDWPGQGTVLYNGGSAPVTAAGTMFGPLDNTYNVNLTVSATTITATFPNGWTFDTTPVSLDGLAITDPLVTITGVSLGSNTTGGSPQLSFDGNDVYINFPHPAFSSLPAGATLTVNVTFAASAPAAPYALPAGSTEQFTAIGNYSSGPSQDLTGSVTWATTPVSGATATVTSGGIVSGSSAGTTTITATLGGVQGRAAVTIPALVSIAVTPSFPSISGTNTQQFTATGTYSDSNTQDLTGSVTWTSSTTGVATITTAGLATGVTPGSTTISAVLGGVTGSMLLTVNPAAP
jgi:Bacterial Ig-like domain (group 3)/MBG domain (YGX type)/Bacterial Ig-like domain (group 2)